MIEVYVNETLVDLPLRGIDLGIDYAIFDVNSIGARQGTRSYSVELPYTDRNKQAFGGNDILNNQSLLPYTKIPARIVVDGVDIKIRFCTLRSIKKNFSVEFYGGNSDIFYDLNKLQMRDLDLSEWNHFWDFDTVLNSRTNTEGFIYPLIDFLYPRNGFTEIAWADIRTDLMCPFYFIDTILKKIFSELNYTFVNELESETWYQDNPILIEAISTTKDKRKGRYSARFGLGPNVFDNNGSYLISEEVVSSDFNYFTDDTHLGNYSVGYVFADTSVTLKVSGKLYFENPFAPATIMLTIKRNGDAAITGQTLTITVPVSSGGGVADAVVDFEFDEFTTEDSTNENYLQIYIFGANLTSESYSAYGSYMDIECISINEYSTYLNYNTQLLAPFTHSYITAAQMMPDISQSEFIKNYCQMFGLIVIYNELINEVRFVRMDKILSNLGKAKDWSSKIEIDEAEITFLSSNYAQNNLFKYAEQSGESKPEGTDGTLVIDNKNLENEKTVIELYYAATNSLVSVSGSDYILRNIIDVHEKQVELDDDGVPIAYIYNRFQSIPTARILFLQRLSNTDLGYDLTYTDKIDTTVVTTDMPFTWFIQNSQLIFPQKEYNLGFGNNLLGKNYRLITSILERSKNLSVPIRLNAADINQLDFTVPVFLSQYESYFYINKIEGYSPNSNTSCLVELVKLNL